MSSERAELARLCSTRNWSKAIRLLDSVLARSPSSIHDLCNRAFCYSHLELHKHVVKDCDRALQLDRALLQAYVLKGKALSALDKKEDALLVWKQGYEIAVRDTVDLKQLLELEELVSSVKICETTDSADHIVDASPCDTKVVISEDRVVDTSSTATTMADTKTVVCEEAIGNSKVSSNGDSKLTNHKVDNNKVSSSPVKDSTGTQAPKKAPKLDKKNKAKAVKEMNGRAGVTDRTSSDESETISLDQTLFATKISKSSKSISLDFRLSRGIAQVNEGKYDQAISIFDQILRETPTYPEALIGRGTAYAFQRELNSAISDFTKAIQSNPSAGEAWKRRGQARAALGEFKEAIEDLTKALEFEPNSPDILHERGIVNFKFKDYNSALEDLSTCVKRDKKNSSAHTYLGLTLSALGEYKRAEDEHLVGIKYDESFLDCWAHLAQLYLDLAYPEKLLNCLEKAIQIDSRFAKAYHLRGILYHGMGRHRSAIKELSIALTYEGSSIECLYLRASCHHAIGEYKAAIKDYDDVLDLELDSMDKFVLQCLAFYQKEMALYIASKANLEFSQFNIDDDVDPLFKDVYNIAVKWRQISEPCDPVVWVNKLSEEFNSGFGSHTPMLLGQAKVVRVLETAKTIMLDLKYVNNAEDRAIFLTDIEKLKKIEVASSCSDLYHIVGETYWVATRCDSMAFQGGKTGFDFAIRTPCTPSRWEEYDEEMAAAWEAICEAYCNDTNPTRDPGSLDAVKDAILRMTYYW
nr:unnamed protein product [Digitaria exilis]